MSIHRIHHDLYKGAKKLADPGDAGTIRVTEDLQICEMVTTAAGGETRTLQNPTKPGILFTLRLLTDGGDATVTGANGLNVTGNTIAAFEDDGDLLHMISVTHTTGYRWEILVNTGAVSLS